MVTFKEFKVGDLFDVTQGRRLKKSDFQDGDIPFVMASSKNNGVVAYLSNPVTTNENFITADILGNMFYQDGFVGFGDDNCGLKLKHGHESEAVYLYLVGVLSRFKSIASYGNKLRGKWYEEQFIHLPVKPGTDETNYSEADIDWDYMASRIRELEAARIRELDAYLQETGLDNYELTDSERSLLEVEPTFGEFKVGELFDVTGNKQVKSQKNIVESSDGIPFVVQSTKNNMVKCHVDRERLLAGGETVYDGNAIVLGVVSPVASYQEYEFGASQSISLRADFLNPIRGLYFVTAIKKVIESKYSYTNLPGIEKYKNDVIQLPLKPGTNVNDYTDADIDWDYMEATIRIMEKQVIRDVVDYKDAVIAKTKELVN